MRDRGKPGHGSAQQGSPAQVARSVAGDTSSSKLAKLARNVGNDELQKRLGANGATRDELLKYLVERLKVVRDVQLKELALATRGANFAWFPQVTSSEAMRQLGQPEPTRWKEVAHTYEQASAALCRGDVGRGAQLVRQAADQEQQAFRTLTKLVEVTEAQAQGNVPASAGAVIPAQACGACAEPEGVALARDIQNVTTQVEEAPVKPRVADPWWTEDEEEEEEAKPEGA